MLCDQPRGLGALLTGEILRRPPVLRDQFSQTRRILQLHGLHSRRIRPAKLVRRKKLFAHPMIFGAKTEQFPAKCFN
jgi:hypothetical protein